jgi:uncharacterized membrane protein YphA (DoxX/SURF4 family)
MSDRQANLAMWRPDLWIGLLRIGVGGYFAKALVTKFSLVSAAGPILRPAVSPRWVAALPRIVARQAAGNPIGWYRDFLTGTVLTHGALFAHLTAWGEAVTGVLLVLGFLTGIGSLIGICLVVNYGLATQWMASSQLVMHVLLLALFVTFFLARAGRCLGVDAVLARRHSWLARRPWS